MTRIVTQRTVEIPYTPREIFRNYHENTKRNAITVAHRRAGKTVARINRIIKSAALCPNSDPRFGYVAPYFVQAKDIAWNYLKHYARPVLSAPGAYQAKINESELSITMPHNNAVVRLYGAENIDRMQGLYFDGIAIDEAQDIAPSALSRVILPTLADRGGWLDVSGKPRGWNNLLGVVYKRALAEPQDWFCELMRASETGIIPKDELDRLRRLMPDNEYLQEFECSFDAAITGAYYAEGIAEASADGRVTSVPYDKAVRVYTWWDLGMADDMVIWFAQLVGREIHLIDYYADSGKGFDHYARVLDEKGYLYGKHIAPHDIAVRELGTGRSRLETAESLGINFETAPNIPVKDGIDAVRMVMHRCWFDRRKTEAGLDALKQYREKRDEKRNVSLGPLHDWTSHAADALRIGIVALEEKAIAKRKADSEVREYGNNSGGWMA